MVCLVVNMNMCKKLRNLWWQDKSCSMKMNWCLIADVWNTIFTDGLPLSSAQTKFILGLSCQLCFGGSPARGRALPFPWEKGTPGKYNHCEAIDVSGFFPLPFIFVIITLKNWFLQFLSSMHFHETMWLLALWEKGQLQAKFAILHSLTSFWRSMFLGSTHQWSYGAKIDRHLSTSLCFPPPSIRELAYSRKYKTQLFFKVFILKHLVVSIKWLLRFTISLAELETYRPRLIDEAL